MIDPDVVYDDVPTKHYIAYFDDAGDGSVSGGGPSGWYRWPAEAGGWHRRRVCAMPNERSGVYELPGPNARLALLLSGAPVA
jgi:hypothetical protein